MTPTEHLPSQPTPTPEENAKLAKQNWREWIELTDQEWDAIIQQLTDREIHHLGGGVVTGPEALARRAGRNPYPRITPELKSAMFKYARRKVEAEMTRRGISGFNPPEKDYEQEREPLQIPLIREPTAEEQMERLDHTFPRRFWGWGADQLHPEHTNYTDESHFRRYLERLSLPVLKELLKESASKMNDLEILMTEWEIENKEKIARHAKQMLEEIEQPHATE